MAQVGIKRGIERVPGGMMVVPLLIGAMFATFAPGTGDFFGSFTGARFKGALPILAVFYSAWAPPSTCARRPMSSKREELSTRRRLRWEYWPVSYSVAFLARLQLPRAS